MPVYASFPVTPTSVPGSGMAVDVYVKDDTLAAAPIVGVTVNVYEPGTLNQVATATTDDEGRAAFLLAGAVSPGRRYEVRVFKAGVLFWNPSLIEVLDPLGDGQSNKFDVPGTLLTLPVSPDPRVCRCTGQFLDVRNQPIKDLLVRISMDAETPTPKVVDGSLVASESLHVRTGADGRVSVDLIRNGSYQVMFAGESDKVWPIQVPDRASVNLINLIHPEPARIDWDSSDAPAGAVGVLVGGHKPVHATLVFSSYQELEESLDQFLEVRSSNEAVATAQLASDGVMISGVSPGTAIITVTTKKTLAPNRVPPISISASLEVTVS